MKNLNFYQVFKISKNKTTMSEVTILTNFRRARKAARSLKLKDGEVSILGRLDILRKY